MHKSIWARLLLLIASWAVIAAAIWVLAISIILVVHAQSKPVNKFVSATATVEQNLPVVSTSTDSLKKYISVNDVIPGLIQCESGGVDLVHLDVDGYYSYDVTQFHLLTFLNFGKKYGVIPATTTIPEARKLIMQPDLVIQLTSIMLKNGLWRQWQNCGLALGLDNNTIIY